MLTKKFVRLNIVNISILLFLVLFSIIHYLKPGFIYNKEGGFRPFGVGYKHKTVVPMWLIAIFLAILCYMFVLVYVLNM
jgi:hypothetical protein|tara:strand:+ start:17806 stop:18042 length:237 start_codon:yes stop_codon:yes gene_type:complete